VVALAPAYLPRRPTETVLYALVRQNLESFLAYAREHYDGGLPRYVEQEFRRYLACGDFYAGRRVMRGGLRDRPLHRRSTCHAHA